MKGVQHAVADEPVRARHLDLRIGPVAIQRPIQLARQFADDLEERRVCLERNRRDIVAALGDGVLVHGVSLLYLYIVKMP